MVTIPGFLHILFIEYYGRKINKKNKKQNKKENEMNCLRFSKKTLKIGFYLPKCWMTGTRNFIKKKYLQKKTPPTCLQGDQARKDFLS